MVHDAQLVPYLAGDLAPGQAEAFEAHLVDCDDCWRAVSQDRRGRALAESLRELAPASLRDRVRMAVEADTGQGGRSRGPRRRVGAALAVAVIAVVAAAWAATVAGDPREPASVAAVVDAARQPVPPASVVAAGETVVLERARLDGRDVTVGRAAVTFPMPDGASQSGEGLDAVWVAKRGDLTVVCLSRPGNLLLAASLPAERLIAWGRQLPASTGPA
ncbi:MAG: anti-sigma factor family protein [Acidimicrobiales bacterium]